MVRGGNLADEDIVLDFRAARCGRVDLGWSRSLGFPYATSMDRNGAIAPTPNAPPQAGEGWTRAGGMGGWGLLETPRQGAMTIAAKICGLSSEAAVAAAVEGGAA